MNKTCSTLGDLPMGRRIVIDTLDPLWVDPDATFSVAAADCPAGSRPFWAYSPFKLTSSMRSIRTGFVIWSGRRFLTGGAANKNQLSGKFSVPTNGLIEVGSPIWEGLHDIPVRQIMHMASVRFYSPERMDAAHTVKRSTNMFDDTPEYRSLAAMKLFMNINYRQLKDMYSSWPELDKEYIKNNGVYVFGPYFISRLFTYMVGQKVLDNIGTIGRIVADLVPDEGSHNPKGMALEGFAQVNGIQKRFYFSADERLNPGVLCATLGRLPTKRDVMRVLGVASKSRACRTSLRSVRENPGGAR